MTCPHCHAANADGARFCGACGQAMSATEPVSDPYLGEAPQLVGREIAGRYRMLAKLGEGGMGAVFRAEQISLKRAVAVKLLRPDVSADPMLLRRFNAEAELVAKLSHPNTVNIYDFGQDTDGTLFIAMELVDGKSLRSVIHSDAPLPLHRALAIAVQVAASLTDAHSHSIIHRDLKPDNVILQDRGRTRDVVRVLDFGIAKLRDDSRTQQMTQAGDMLGTPQYMAPEQIRAEVIDGRTDVYALGCMLYEMVTARLPFEAPTVLALLSKHLLAAPVPPSQRRPDLGLPPSIDQLILSAMAKDPQQRPPTMEIYGEQIAHVLAMLPPDPQRASPVIGQAKAPAPSGSAYAPATPPRATPPQSILRANPPAASLPVQPPTGNPMHGPVAYAPGTPQPATPYVPVPAARVNQPFVIPPPPSTKKVLVILIVLVVIAGGVVAGVFALRARDAPKNEPSNGSDPWSQAGSSVGSSAVAAASHDPPPAPPPAVDHWGGPSAPPDGSKVEIGQGVELIVPPHYQVSNDAGLTVALDDRGVMIAGGPIDIASNDPKELARVHAQRNHLVLKQLKTIQIGGIQRPMATFSGTVGGVAIRHIAVAIIAPDHSYRVAVIFQAPEHEFADDQTVEASFVDLYARRVVLP